MNLTYNLLIVLMIVGASASAPAQFTNVHYHPLSAASMGVNSDIARAGDVNSDGIVDYMIGTSGDGGNGGHVIVYSGADGSELHHIVGALGGGRVGISVSGIGDVNGDGFDDFMTGVAQSAGGVSSSIGAQVYSGLTGTPLYTIPYPIDSDQETAVVARFSDITGDGMPDFGVGFPKSGITMGGRVMLFSGFDGTLIREYIGIADDFMGSSLANAHDVDGDGVNDVLVGSTQTKFSTAFYGAGRVDLFSGATGALIHSTVGYPMGVFGSSVLGLGDINQDGIPDYLVGAPGLNINNGAMLAYSGSDGSLIYTAFFPGVAGSLGRELRTIGDLNGDNIVDFSAENAFPGGSNSRLYSGVDGSVLVSPPVPTLFPFPGHAIQSYTGIGDINNDGNPDLASVTFRHDSSFPNQIEVYTFLSGIHPVLSYSSQSGNLPQLTLTWSQDPNDSFGASGRLACTGASPGASGLILASLASADLPVFGFDLLAAVDPINLVLTATLGATAAGTFHAGQISRRNPAIAGSKLFVQFIETAPVIRASNGIRFIAIP